MNKIDKNSLIQRVLQKAEKVIIIIIFILQKFSDLWRWSAHRSMENRNVIVELCVIKVAGNQLQIVIGNQLASFCFQSSLS